jgi:aryl carrier-like protein
LPVPELPAASDADFAAPQSAIEIALAEIWRDVLKLERVSVTDDLFALGADSINLFQITARANREGLALMAKQLLQHRTIGELAASLEATAAEGLRPAFERPSLRRSLRERLQSSA